MYDDFLGFFENITFHVRNYCEYFLGNHWNKIELFVISTSGHTDNGFYDRPCVCRT